MSATEMIGAVRAEEVAEAADAVRAFLQAAENVREKCAAIAPAPECGELELAMGDPLTYGIRWECGWMLTVLEEMNGCVNVAREMQGFLWQAGTPAEWGTRYIDSTDRIVWPGDGGTDV